MGWETNGSPDCCHMPLVTLSLRCQILEIFSKPCLQMKRPLAWLIMHIRMDSLIPFLIFEIDPYFYLGCVVIKRWLLIHLYSVSPSYLQIKLKIKDFISNVWIMMENNNDIVRNNERVAEGGIKRLGGRVEWKWGRKHLSGRRGFGGQKKTGGSDMMGWGTRKRLFILSCRLLNATSNFLRHLSPPPPRALHCLFPTRNPGRGDGGRLARAFAWLVMSVCLYMIFLTWI